MSEYDLFDELLNFSPTVPPSVITDVIAPVPQNSSSDEGNQEEKKKERAIRNRQSAQASRERKRQYVTTLEQSNMDLQQEAKRLKGQVAVLQADKEYLQREISSLRHEFEALKQMVTSSLITNTPVEMKVPDENVKGVAADHLAIQGQSRIIHSPLVQRDRPGSNSSNTAVTNLVNLNVDCNLLDRMKSSPSMNLPGSPSQQQPFLRIRIRRPVLNGNNHGMKMSSLPKTMEISGRTQMSTVMNRKFGFVHGKISSLSKPRSLKKQKRQMKISRRLIKMILNRISSWPRKPSIPK